MVESRAQQESTVYDVLDEWFGERFNIHLTERLRLPLEQALELFEFSTGRRLTSLPFTSTEGRLAPAVRPWPLEAHEHLFAVGGARMWLHITSNQPSSGGPYGHVRYSGSYQFGRLPTDKAIALGPYSLWAESHGFGPIMQKVQRIAALALYAHEVRLPIDALLPDPPELENDRTYSYWLADVQQRLMVLSLLRWLHTSGAVKIGRVEGMADSGKATQQQLGILSDPNFAVSDAEVREVTSSLKLIIKGAGPLSDPQAYFRELTAKGLVAQELVATVAAAAHTGAHLHSSSEAATRRLSTVLSGGTSNPQETILDRWVTLQIPLPAGDFAQMLAATSQLRSDNDAFRDWRQGVSNSLLLADSLMPNAGPDAVRRMVAESLGSHVRNLRAQVDRRTVRETGLREAAATFVIGGVGLGATSAVSEQPEVAAGFLGLGAIGLLAAVRSYYESRKRAPSPNPALDTYTSLKFEAVG